MFTKRVILLVVGLCCLFAIVSTATFAQSISSGTVTGIVKDPQGALVAGATVTLTDKSTNTSRTTTTNKDEGKFYFADVTPGIYTITIKKDNFKTVQFSNQNVPLGSVLTLNSALELGSVTQTIEVTANGAELQTMNATVGNSVTGVALNKLPSIGRDTGSFVTLQPGVSPDGSVAGTVVDQSTFMLDGGQNTNDMDGSMNVYTPSFAGDPTGVAGGGPTGVLPTPIDSVEEFKVNTVGQTSDFNSSAGAQVQVVTRRGTNSWHGGVYEYYLDNNFSANSWDNNSTAPSQKLASYHFNRSGAAIGGPIVPWKVLGGKTYFFANFEGFWWPNSAVYERAVPSADMRVGILHLTDASDPLNPVVRTYNLNTGMNCGPTGLTACDSRGIGINTIVKNMWNTYMPLPNDPGCTTIGIGSTCDGINEQGYRANMSLPYTSYFGVARLDHDFGDKWHFNASYRYYHLRRATTNQVDIGGFFPGDVLGVPTSKSSRPQVPWYLVFGLTTNINNNTTNDFHFSYLRNFWEWADKDGPAQFAGLGGALEPFGESATKSLVPYNVNTQSVRTRFWNGQDKFLRDDITMLHGKHLFTFGASYQHNYDVHQRSDNGGGINYTPTYQLGETGGGGLVSFSATNPIGVSGSRWARASAAVLGIVTDSQVAYTRSGSTLVLNPPLTHAFDQSTIPYYNVYFSDSWHLKPSFTLTYGLGWTLEMPPVEKFGKQIELVDAASQQLDVTTYLNTRASQALLGNVYNPFVGFALVGNTGGGQKYPYMPFYGSFSPRVAFAWNPRFENGFMANLFGHNETVIRGGFSVIYGRLNGVDLVLVPLLGTGLIQPVQCRQAFMSGACGPTNPTVTNAFRIGTDGLVAPIPAASATLPQPDFPGVNDVSAAAGEALDVHFRPNVVKSFDLTIQRQLSPKMLLEIGYIGRLITHEYQPININAVPYMMTKGGQTFAKAYAAIETGLGCATSYNACGATIPGTAAAATIFANAFTPQPFFENALSGTGYCTGFASCTAAVVFKEGFSNINLVNQQVWNIWSDLDKGGIGGGPGGTTVPGFNFSRSMLNSPVNTSAFGGSGQLTSGVGLNASVGVGNYHAGFISLRLTNWHGLSGQANFTYSKALGTGAFVQATSQYTPNDSFNINEMYGVQGFNRKFVANGFLVYELPFFKSQKGFVGHILGGWSIAPTLAVGSGLPVYCNTNTDAQSYGSGDANGFFNNEQCHFTGNLALNQPVQRYGTGTNLNLFTNAAASFNLARPGILGLDTKDAGVGPIVGQRYWNVDTRLSKNVKITERVSLDLEMTTINIFNHNQLADGVLDPTSAGTWGNITTQLNAPRQMQFGARIKF